MDMTPKFWWRARKAMAQNSSSTSHQQHQLHLLEAKELRYLDRGPFSFFLDRGECLGLSGKSGVGKSQLYRAITDLIPYQGELLFEGISCQLFPAPQWRKKVTMVPAESSWWYDEVGEHFAMGGELAGNLPGWLNRLGFDQDVLKWQIRRLSTGEKQRLTLLRTLQFSPEVVLLDEPSSALDHGHTIKLEEFIRDYQQTNDIGVIWVSHDPEQLVRMAARELRLEKEGVVEFRNSYWQ
jgi:ABC-type iron transport system FetAB ATPase subunit